MEKQKATSILNDIMEKLSLIKKDDVKEVELKNQEVNLSEQIKEEEEMSQQLTELACQEEVVAEELSSNEVEAEKLEEEAPVEEVSEESLNEDKYVSREEFDSKIKAIMDKIEEMSLGYQEEKVSMSKQIEELSKEPAAEPINQGSDSEPVKKVLYAQNRAFTTKDRVLNSIYNLNN